MNHYNSRSSWMSIFIFFGFFMSNIAWAGEGEGNEVTLETYELGLNEYIANTPAVVSDTCKAWIDQTLALLLPNARIIEIGSGFGRDACYMESHGFIVERTDAAKSFVSFLQQKGYSASQFNLLTDPFPAKYDLIYANCVFLHFTPQELEYVLHKAYDGLSKEGILSFSLKCGEGEVWTTEKMSRPRYFCYWNADKIRILLESIGFEIIFLFQDQKFIQIIAHQFEG